MSAAAAPPAATPVQRTLLHVPEVHLTLPLSGARVLLARDDDQLHELIELGRLEWVWNIATPEARNRELRFLVAELRGFSDLRSPISDLPAVIGRLLGEEKPFVDGTAFRRAFNCDSDHVLNLIRAGTLAVLPNTSWRRGPNGTPAIAWASAVRFVKERKL